VAGVAAIGRPARLLHLGAAGGDGIMQRFMLGSALALACSVGVAAQSTTVKSESKVEVKDGKDVTVTGCVGRSASGTSFTLNNVEGKGVTSRAFILVGNDDLDDHVGHLVQVKGKAANVGDGKLEVTTKTRVDRDDADDKETETKTKVEGDLAGIPFLGVKSVKMIRASC
jgi:trehalose-6-phosphatase